MTDPKDPAAENVGEPEETREYPTSPAEERGERIETGRQIARGGKPDGRVAGATGDDPADPRSGND